MQDIDAFVVMMIDISCVEYLIMSVVGRLDNLSVYARFAYEIPME
jgi:hypothetical protein